ncbi:hypothetical protein [Vagococcus silagei]|uniref:Uncharacterized protein n=1 Tax=Vagococcus silagei TaxID=2508885 RepID=A0A4S3AZU4_9ENTE|nr:hypothetical protein [Vagococcus silagei]THB60271.1 hypothetical protein ESZ54_11510 [Vagococcus silagei]
MERKEPFELKITYNDARKSIFIGVLLLFFTIGMVVWLIIPFFTIKSIHDIISSSLLLFALTITGIPFLVYFMGFFSFALIQNGLIFQMLAVSNSKIKK